MKRLGGRGRDGAGGARDDGRMGGVELVAMVIVEGAFGEAVRSDELGVSLVDVWGVRERMTVGVRVVGGACCPGHPATIAAPPAAKR